MRDLKTYPKDGETYPGPLNWERLRDAWFEGQVYSGPSEKYDAERAWDAFVADHETPVATSSVLAPPFIYLRVVGELQDGSRVSFEINDSGKLRVMGRAGHFPAVDNAVAALVKAVVDGGLLPPEPQ